MKKAGPIIIIEDDIEDQELLEETFKVLNYPNKVIFFSDGHDALAFLGETKSKPFLILSDINMPRIDGFQIKKEINKVETLRAIPHLFFTTSSQQRAIEQAYEVSSQGYFIKPSSAQSMQNTIRKIVDYWLECHSPTKAT